MSKIIYIDIGTHFGQEYDSLFGSNLSYFKKAIRRIIGYYIYNRGKKLTINQFYSIFKLRNKFKELRKNFLIYFVEANPKIIINKKVYSKADCVFNFALTNNNSIDITKLYIAKNNPLSHSNSIFKKKFNTFGWKTDKFIPTIGVPAKEFFYILKNHIDNFVTEYLVVLRINCEGVEDDIVYEAHSQFKNKLALISGSLKDVKICKSDLHYNKMINYMKLNKLPFVSFSPSIETWFDAHRSIIKIYKDLKNKS